MIIAIALTVAGAWSLYMWKGQEIDGGEQLAVTMLAGLAEVSLAITYWII